MSGGERVETSPIVNQVKQLVIDDFKRSDKIERWFLKGHLLVVEKIANQLCEMFPKADREIVQLGVWLHDRERIFGVDESHDKLGADKGRQLVVDMGYDAGRADKVWEICRAHGVKDVKPVSLEAKILATADAMSHFEGDFYERAERYYERTMGKAEARDKVVKKMKRDFREKICFEVARERVKERYEELMKKLN